MLLYGYLINMNAWKFINLSMYWMPVNVLLAHMSILRDCYECLIEDIRRRREWVSYAQNQNFMHAHKPNAIFIIYLQVNEQSFNLEKREYRDGVKQDWNGGILVMF